MSSKGVIKAIMSGMLAGHMIWQVLINGCSEALAADSYRQIMSRWFQHEVHHLRQLYSQLPHPPDLRASSRFGPQQYSSSDLD